MIGFIGLGRMGGGMARRLVANGLSVIGFDTSRDVLTAFEAAGGTAAGSVRDVADKAEVVFASLPTLAASDAVVLGDGGVAEGKRIKIYVETSTIGKQAAERLSRALKDAGDICFLDSPVSGGPKGANEGTLTTVTAGPKWAFDEVQPYWRHMADNVVYVGDRPGLGQIFKVVNNYIVMSSLAATCEAVAMGVRAGADEATLVGVLNHATGRNFATSVYFPSMILPRAQTSQITMALKDVRLFADQAAELGLSSDCADSLVSMWQEADSRGLSLVEWYQSLLPPE